MVSTIYGVILFGGFNSINNESNDNTWKWDGKYWSQSEDIGPSPRSNHAMAYHAKRDRVVLFAGGLAGVNIGDTWELKIESIPK
jgi:hypothetical protein